MRRGDRYVLKHGEKMWITNGSVADVALIGQNAKTKKFAASCGKGNQGFKAWDVHGKLSLRASVTSGLSIKRLRSSHGKMCLPGGRGLRGPLSCCLTAARYGIGWGSSCVAMACYDTASANKQDAKKDL